MDDRPQLMINLALNDQKYIRHFNESQSAFKPQKKVLKVVSQKLLLKGNFYSYSSQLKEFKQFYFELYPNLLLRYPDKNKAPPIDYLLCQFFYINQIQEVIGDQAVYGIDLVGEEGIARLMTDKYQVFRTWFKSMKRYCKLQGFQTRFKVEKKIYEHFYQCFDRKKKQYTAVKINGKKGMKPEQRRFVENEITIIRKLVCPILPPLKKIYEDANYYYMTFQYFRGEDLMNIAQSSKLEEIAVATLAYHILKGLKVLHFNGYFHGNLKLDNIIFSTNKKDNEIFLINFKFLEEITPIYRERLIKKGQNFYIAPELLEDQPFDYKIDIFSLGVCLFYMVFKKFPYSMIEKDQFSEIYKYELDLSLLEEMKTEKKRNPSSKQALSASGIDFFLKLLDKDPNNRPTASQGMNHSWFINFTSKQGKNKNKGQRSQIPNDFDNFSLRTIIESSEISEREIELNSRIISTLNPINGQVKEEDQEYSEASSSQEEQVASDDEAGGLQHLMQSLEKTSLQMAPSKESKNFISTQSTASNSSSNHSNTNPSSNSNYYSGNNAYKLKNNQNILEELEELEEYKEEEYD